MNAKMKKLLSEMKKIEDKKADLQAKWEELNKQKTELENIEIIGLIRGAKISTENLSDVLKAYGEQNRMPLSIQKQEEKSNEEI